MNEGADWTEQYPVGNEEIDEKLPTPLGKELPTTIYLDLDHAQDQKTRSFSSQTDENNLS